MSEQFLSKINWQQPWLLPLRDLAHSVLQHQDWKHEINRLMQEQGLCNFAGQPLQCIPQQDLPEGEQYETHIHSTGGIPTRDNLHDFFNALMWLRFPQIKKILPAHIQIIDSGEAVAKQVKNVLKEKVGFSTIEKNEPLFYTNSNPKVLYEILENKYTIIEKDF